jgi:hypothetical protein
MTAKAPPYPGDQKVDVVERLRHIAGYYSAAAHDGAEELERLRAWQKQAAVTQQAQFDTICRLADKIEAAQQSVLQLNSQSVRRAEEIARLERELTTQKLVNELAYIPHRQLVASRDEMKDARDRAIAALEGLHFHHKMFEPLCRHCRSALRGD